MDQALAPIFDALRPYFTPITHNVPAPLASLSVSLLGPACHQTLLLDLQPTTPCLKLAFSKTLGLAIISASSIVKVPQILKLVASKSPAGISFSSYALETLAYLISLAYNTRMGFPFSTYGETALIAAQNVVIAVLVLQYAGHGPLAASFVATLAAVGWALFREQVVGMDMLGTLMAGAGALGVVSKVPQIWTVYQDGGTGQLSAFAVFNYLMGSLTRIFTTLQEVDDKLILYGFVAGFALNAVLAAQVVYYWNSPQTAGHAGKIGKKPEAIAMGSSTSAQPKVKSPTTRRRG
ncbi:Mannose-P-dolichol utilization defect 1 protein [Xylographa opegraphella]|nr:Mannose-P-dolichol utilization defect 1 protein [Xylographa opegraphella]